MTTHELYINDTLIDLDKDVNIYLLYQSMLFTDLQNIVSNRSYNISLPKTDNNLRAISHFNLADRADEVADGLTFPRKYHKVRYYRNGITIFERGIGTFMGVDSRINFVFAWGNAENFQQLFDKKLTELTNIADAHISWNENTQYFDMPFHEEFSYGFLNVDFGQGSQIRYQHPCVRSEYILGAIARQNGIRLKLSEGEDGDGYDYYGLRDFVIPLTTKMGDEQSLDAQSLTARAFSRRYRPGPLAPPWDYSSIDPDMRSINDPMGLWAEDGFAFVPKDRGLSKLRLIISYFSAEHPKDNKSHTYKYEFNNQSLGKPWATESMGIVYVSYPAVDTIVEVSDIYEDSSGKKLNSITIDRVLGGVPAFPSMWLPQIKVIPIEMPLTLPTLFPILPNLPDMTQADFIKGLMQLTGLFAYVKAENEICFVSIDDILAKKNTQYAKDWTDKLLNTVGTYNAPEGVEFKLENFAQRNLCKWDDGDDEQIKGKYDGVIVVENETIEREKECFKLPFAPTENVDYVSGDFRTKIARIPVYTKQGDAIEYNDDVTARILKHKELNGHLGASFESMDMGSVIRTKYSGYQEVLRTPRVIKVRCLLNDFDLSELDLTSPVYFEQYGNYYAILKVQAAADGVCKCEFLEI